MKIKPLYIYLLAFLAFIVGVILFTNTSTENKTKLNSSNQMPDDSIHKGISGSAEMPSSANVMASIKEQIDNLKSEYEKNPDDTLKARQYADLLRMAHQLDNAGKIYLNILKKDPNRIDILLELTFVYYNSGDLNKADEITQKILSISKDHQIGLYNSGAIAYAKGDVTKAKSVWQRIIKKYPNTEIARISEESIKQLNTTSQK